MTATCARLAASATRVKSLRKASVDGDVGSWAGGCGTAGCAMALAGDDCCVEDRGPDETARDPMGEVIGAFMLCDGYSCTMAAKALTMRCVSRRWGRRCKLKAPLPGSNNKAGALVDWATLKESMTKGSCACEACDDAAETKWARQASAGCRTASGFGKRRSVEKPRWDRDCCKNKKGTDSPSDGDAVKGLEDCRAAVSVDGCDSRRETWAGGKKEWPLLTGRRIRDASACRHRATRSGLRTLT
ncbi:hypothetical protein VFPBJ_09924 [Purpureocillium lilacinum]|uniref:Uncharacterized protein n=1 Tax=Purpureocillium lilacinum TaxID=33203 RepID=A0A179GBV8_PURLI|nr:hypothetical protein VFPBJ_09924 [Purpureocillium lilacinum]